MECVEKHCVCPTYSTVLFADKNFPIGRMQKTIAVCWSINTFDSHLFTSVVPLPTAQQHYSSVTGRRGYLGGNIVHYAIMSIVFTNYLHIHINILILVVIFEDMQPVCVLWGTDEWNVLKYRFINRKKLCFWIYIHNFIFKFFIAPFISWINLVWILFYWISDHPSKIYKLKSVPGDK